MVVAERVRERVATLSALSDFELTTRLTVSIGVVECVAKDASFSSIVSRADEALYRAKMEGRDRVCAGAG